MSVETADRLRCHCPKCIDFHTHFLERNVVQAALPHNVSSCFGKIDLPLDLPVFRPMFDPELQIEDMNRRGIDANVLSSCDVMQSRGWATFDEERRMCALVNEECVRWVESYPGRFIGSAVLPLGDIDMAVACVDEAVRLGLKIINMPTNYRGDYLGHARFIELFERIDELGLAIFVHPEGVTDMWFQDYALWNSIGQSIEEVKVMSSLIYEGAMDRFPNIRIVMAHGGGFLPHYMGRLDRNVRDKPFTAKNISKKPSEYLSDFYYDSCVYDPKTLELLIKRVGIDRVVLGGDYPVADIDPIDFLDELDLSDSDRAKIAGGNAIQLLGLS
ncbi:amidohydrolase family protein [Rhizorhabdus sp.]|jgi:aminocarboxymuconate-semialdehyde decarboxylase|uniref:amidohydrolase family protein n=1 Tax=Rhizorhabdus sp. TaxID=1968843 RepID=UPI0019B597C8|nr:amidohydrolase family protein [Rhizorhabdus sp.]MBD3759322.1 amidohydrolase [Rhizorhabdus sp.]